jgi:hypothetical protein
VSGLEQHESQVAMQTLESIKNLLSVYEKTIENERIRQNNEHKLNIIKCICVSVVVLISACILLLAPSKIDVKNVSESKSGVINSELD